MRRLQEDVQGIAITSYQGGHVEFFKYMVDLLRAERRREHQGVRRRRRRDRAPREIRELQAYGVTRLYSPEDGAKMGLQGMIDDVVRSSDYDLTALAPAGGRGARGAALAATAASSRASSPRSRIAVYAHAHPPGAAAGGRRHQDARCSASPARAGRANPRSPMS